MDVRHINSDGDIDAYLVVRHVGRGLPPAKLATPLVEVVIFKKDAYVLVDRVAQVRHTGDKQLVKLVAYVGIFMYGTGLSLFSDCLSEVLLFILSLYIFGWHRYSS